jgi:hypothetical protein
MLRSLPRLYYDGRQSKRSFLFIFLYFTHVTTCFGPSGPPSGEHYRFLEASYCL